MSANAIISAVNHRRIRRARAWLEGRAAAEEVLIVGATLDAANELARGVAKEKGAAFGWHRLTLSPLAAAIAAPVLATRGLAESLARSLGPSKIHVSLIIIDGIVDEPSIRTKLADKLDSFFVKPDDIADTALMLTRQKPSAWTFELEARPFGETW
jgi:NAD(P)-dependent dehydrogenase (short-subunit alcohol dehydrogenase family)